MKRKLFSILALLFAVSTAWADNVNYYDPTDADNPTKTAVNPTPITSETIALYEGWYYVSGEVTCNNRIEVEVYGTVNIILMDDCSFTVSDGIHVPSNSTLYIYAQKAGSGCGALTAYRYQWGDCGDGAAIGGDGGINQLGTADPGEASGTICIYGGNITANGNIGGGNGGRGTMEYIDEWTSNNGYGGDGG